jgi:hypothetical protein
MPRRSHQVALVRDRIAWPGDCSAARPVFLFNLPELGLKLLQALDQAGQVILVAEFPPVRGPALDPGHKASCFEFRNVGSRLSGTQFETLTEGLHLRERFAFSFPGQGNSRTPMAVGVRRGFEATHVEP